VEDAALRLSLLEWSGFFHRIEGGLAVRLCRVFRPIDRQATFRNHRLEKSRLVADAVQRTRPRPAVAWRVDGDGRDRIFRKGGKKKSTRRDEEPMEFGELEADVADCAQDPDGQAPDTTSHVQDAGA